MPDKRGITGSRKAFVGLLSNEDIVRQELVAQHQINAYRAFVKACDGDITEALIQTEIYMRALFKGKQ